jgi:RNA polymerase sigma factor for flagellar operon FliA
MTSPVADSAKSDENTPEPAPAPALTMKHHQLVREALPVVGECASHVCWRYDLQGRPERRHVHTGSAGDCVGYSDMGTIGKLALYDAVQRYQEGRNRSFARFARYRVFGAMMNEVKATTRQRRIEREMLRAFAYYMADYVDDFNIMQHDRPEMQRRVDVMCDAALAVMFVVGAEEARREAERDVLADAEENADAIEALREIVAELDDDQRRLLDMLFAHGFDQHRVGEEIGVTRETVNRRMARLTADLKRLLKTFGIKRAPPLVQLGEVRPVLSEPRETATGPRSGAPADPGRATRSKQ